MFHLQLNEHVHQMDYDVHVLKIQTKSRNARAQLYAVPQYCTSHYLGENRFVTVNVYSIVLRRVEKKKGIRHCSIRRFPLR